MTSTIQLLAVASDLTAREQAAYLVPTLAALAIVKGVPTPLDLVSITHGGERTISFLSQALGLIAEIDLGTDPIFAVNKRC